MKIIKRNGTEETFEKEKIITAIRKANASVEEKERIEESIILQIADSIEKKCGEKQHLPSVEEVQDMVEDALMCEKKCKLSRSYITYRFIHNMHRQTTDTENRILSLVEYKNEEVKEENSNKNPIILSTQRDYIAGEVSKSLTMRVLLPQDIVDAHNAGIIHFHDGDYFLQNSHNCCLVNLKDMLENGTVISNIMIERPHTFSTACNIATQIIAQVASSQYGGQTISLSHLAPFVDATRKKFESEYSKMLSSMNSEDFKAFIEYLVKKEIERGVQIIQYQVVTLMTTNGQTPFITVCMDINEAKVGQEQDDLALIIEEILRQRIQGVKNVDGAWITPAFPKLIYVLDENNIREGSKYYYLTVLAAKCTAKRMVPDYISAKIMRELKNGDVYPCMGCRSFLTPDRFSEKKGNISNKKDGLGPHQYYGRFNQGVVTISLPDAALSSDGNRNKFWEIMDERTELCYKALMCRHKHLKGTSSDVAPILWQHGALARLNKGEVIDKLLYDGYSTISLGFAGLYECVLYMTGESHTSERGSTFALEIMNFLNSKCKQWKEKENIDFSLYGTPIESTTYRFAKCLKKRFGVISGVTDKNYITNSYHVHVTEEIDAFTKLGFEAQFQALSPGGAVSYVEVPNLTGNIEAVLTVMKYSYENIMYSEINSKSDYCQVCGFNGEIQIVEEDGKLVWECPNCKNRDQTKLNVARRTCGYIGTNFWNQGRTQEIKERVLHLSKPCISMS